MNITDDLEVYLVGGAVRDELLGLKVKERDWVVVGATPEQMLSLGFNQVGRDFPVFLHPHTKEEYALARTERKSGKGYRGFSFDTSDKVTLEEDLRRRDLTVNAIAKADDGRLIDPYGGVADIEARQLRHVSEAFAEDPLRVLRAARFTARFASLGFTIAEETMRELCTIVANGELTTLAAERVWRETQLALATPKPSIYFQVLRACGALGVLFAEIEALFGVEQPAKWHPEIDTGLHTLMVVDMAARLSADNAVRFAALVHDLGKAETPADILPSHRGHEERSIPMVEAMCERLRVPNAWRKLAVDVARDHTLCHRALELKPTTVLKLLQSTGGLRDADKFEQFLVTCEADARGRAGLEEQPYPQRAYLAEAREVAIGIDTRQIAASGLSGAAIGNALNAKRIDVLTAHKKAWVDQAST